MAVREVIEATELPRALIARLAGVDSSTVWAWLRTGRAARAPSPESVRKLAEGLRDYSGRLASLAKRLEQLDR